MKNFFKQNCKALVILFIITVLISILYYSCKESRDIFNSIESILAIPSLILSFIVLKVINIKPENLDAYHRLRVMQENEKKENKKNAKNAFKEKLNEIKELNKKYSQFYNNIIYSNDTANSVKTSCSQGLENLREFFEETNEYIYKDFLPGLKNLGELETIDNINVSIVDLKDKDLLSDKLNEIKKELFTKDELLENDKKLLELLFAHNDGLMQKYLNTCNHAYKEIKEEKDNEI